jgi:DNA (cytosine-5)-methyltransferase 1
MNQSRLATSKRDLTLEKLPIPSRTGSLLVSSYTDDPIGWWNRFMVSAEFLSSVKDDSPKIRVLDLFSSVGGLSLGSRVAAELLGAQCFHESAVDTDLDALQIHQANFDTRFTIGESVRDLVDFRTTLDTPSRSPKFRYSNMVGIGEQIRKVDLLVGGPPCQGHSTLNNRTRSDDPKNQLMLTMPAIAVALGINSVVIENVPNVINDSKRVVQTTADLFLNHGYYVQSGVISATDLGWPQTRRRYFMVARRDRMPIDFGDVVEALKFKSQSLSWIIGDLLKQEKHLSGIFNTVPQLNVDNLRRINWLFDHDEYDLPNHQRPKCHQNGHTYPATYGRMRWDKPAPTITGGFQSPGRGRFIHPRRRRVLTPHEAARVQGFPDFFDFTSTLGDRLSRTHLSKWIGDAVPSILGTAAIISALG